jgi:hypothetical protein
MRTANYYAAMAEECERQAAALPDNNPAHWQHRADETRLLAEHLIDPEAKATILKIADGYDRLAGRALARMRSDCLHIGR